MHVVANIQSNVDRRISAKADLRFHKYETLYETEVEFLTGDKVQCQHKAFVNYYINDKCSYWSDWSFAYRKTIMYDVNYRPKFYMETRLTISDLDTPMLFLETTSLKILDF